MINLKTFVVTLWSAGHLWSILQWHKPHTWPGHTWCCEGRDFANDILLVQLYASFKRIGCCWLHSAARLIPGSKYGCYYKHSTRCPNWLGGNSVTGSWNIRWRSQALVVPIHKNKQVLERLHGCQLLFQYNRIRCGSTNFCWPIGYRINLSKCYRLLQLLFDHTSALPRLSDSCAVCFQFVCFRVVYKFAVMLYVVTSKKNKIIHFHWNNVCVINANNISWDVCTKKVSAYVLDDFVFLYVYLVHLFLTLSVNKHQ